MRRVIGAVLVVIAVMSGACSDSDEATGSDVPADWETYTDEASGFTVSYPPTWETFITDTAAVPKLEADLEAGAAMIEPVSPFGAGILSAEGGLNPGLGVVVEALPSELTVDEYVADHKRVLATFVSSYEVTEEIDTVVGNQDTVLLFATYLLTEEHPAEKGRVWSVEIVTTRGQTGWVTTCNEIAFDGSAPSPDLAECEAAVQSFDFLND